MSRNKLRRMLALGLALTALSVVARADDLIDDTLLVPESANYDTVTITYGDYTKEVTASGYQVFVVEQNLSMEEGSARLRGLNVIRNGQVKAGDVIATYEKEGSRAELERMELELERAKQSFEDGKRERMDQIEVLRTQLAAQTDTYQAQLGQLELQRAQLDYERYVFETEHSLDEQREQIDELTEFYADTELVAPFDGVITWLTTKSEGDTIHAGETLVTLQSQARYVIGLDNSSGNFRYGMRVSVGLGPRNNKEYIDGRIIAAANILPNEDKISYALVELYGEPDENGLKNITVTGNSIELNDVLMIPRTAITFDGGKSYVSILDGDMVQKRIIVSGHNTAGDTWVVQGLTEGQQVIID